jgi:uncharacterized protein
MHININDILAQDIGYSRDFEIQGETPALELVKLTGPINGNFTLTRTEQGVFAAGKLQAEIELECHRCLDTYKHHVDLGFAQSFSEKPGDEDIPITKGSIDLAPVIDQEIAVRLPIKLLCDVDCEGVPGASKEYTKQEESKGL